jgi:hypothetical protein
MAASMVLAGAVFVVVVYLSFPTYSVQMIGAGRGTVALVALIENLYWTTGISGIILVAVYAILAGIAVVIGAGHLLVRSSSGAVGTAGLLPGVFAASCASCAPGLFGLVGAAGAVSLFPVNGTLVRLAAILLLLLFLNSAGHPSRCDT